MTDADIAVATVTVQELERTARAHWDALSDGENGLEYQAAMGVVRQAGSLRKSLENWIVTRATTASRK